jgi:hypothetical protein
MSKDTPSGAQLAEELSSLRRRIDESEQRLGLILDRAELGLWDWDVQSGA